MTRHIALGSAIAFLLCITSAATAGPLVPTSSPDNAWALSQKVGIGQGNSIDYVAPRSDWGGAVPLGFVLDESFFGPFGSNDEDTLRVFQTYLFTPFPRTLNVLWGHDDGGSLYLNGTLLSSTPSTAGPGAGLAYEGPLNLDAGWNFLEMSVYNGPGASSINFGEGPTAYSTPLSAVPGIIMRAELPFVAVPEPTSLALFGLAVAMLGGCYWRPRKKRS